VPTPGHTFPRSLAALAALAAGFLSARATPGIPSTAWFSAAAAAAALSILLRNTPCKLALLTAAACLGAGWFTARLYESPLDSPLTSLHADALITVQGVILDTPRPIAPARDPLNPHVSAGPRLSLRLRISSLHTDSGPKPARGKLWVRAGGQPSTPQAHLQAGDRITLTGLYSPVGPPLNPGEYDRRLWAAQSGYLGSLTLPKLEFTRPPPTSSTPDQLYSTWLLARARTGDTAQRLLLGDDPPADEHARGRALLAALILGQEEPALREVRGAFTRLGLAHVLSISGFHMAVLAMVALIALRAAGDLGRVEPVLVAALVLLYLAILPFNAPAWRSGLMVLGLLIGDAMGRRYDRLATLGWIAIILLLWRPMDLWSIGFQLSFGLVAALIRLSEPAHGRLFGVPLRGTLIREPTPLNSAADWLKRLLSTNLLCCALATPIVAYHTGLVSLVAVATGILVVPLVTIILIASYAAIAIGILIPPITPAAAAAIDHLAAATAALVQWIDAAPGTSLRVPALSLAWTTAATALALFWFLRGRWRSKAAWALTAALAAWTAAELLLGPRLPSSTHIRVDTLAVGDGTCQLLRSGSDAVLWDCGSLTPGVGQLLVPRAARALGAWRVPTLIITHPNLDHYNGTLDIIEPLGVRQVIVGEAFLRRAQSRPHGPEAFLLTALNSRGITVRPAAAGDSIPLGDTQITFLSPPPGALWPLDNDHSLVAAVGGPAPGQPPSRNPARIPLLLTGDIQDQAMASILAAHPGLSPAIMEAPHHGSARPAAYEFVAGTNPTIVLQSTGPGRAADPRWATVRAGRTWLCTAADGASWAEWRQDGTTRSGSFAPGAR